jgi:predicted Zn-dependent protease
VSEALLAKSPANLATIFTTAEVLFAAGRPAEAVDFYAAFNAKVKGPNSTGFCSEARARIGAGEHQKVGALIGAGKQHQRGDALCWLAAGERYLKLGQGELAEVELREASRLDPNHPTIFRRWADSFNALGRSAEAGENQAMASAAEKRNREWRHLR